MNAIRNILAVVGLAVILAAAVMYPKFHAYKVRFAEFDPLALDVYMEMMDKLMETGNPADATVWAVKAADGLSFDEVAETLQVVANEHNLQNVGTLPFYKQVQAMTGKEQRKVVFYLLCDALIGADMLNHSDAYAAYMPCRISLVERADGSIWLYSLNMDMMIHGGDPLPPKLKADALEMKVKMLDAMNRAAKGEF